MKYRVEFAEQAKSDLFEIYAWIALDSPVNAARWLAKLESAIQGLDTSPERCVVAPESEELSAFVVRQLIVGNYRVLYTIRERVVFVLHIRHGSRHVATMDEIAEAIRERREQDPD